MRAVTILDGGLRWQEHEDPEPGTGEVVVAVRAAGLNGADRLQVADVAEQEHGHVSAPLAERTRHHEPVTAVVASPAQDGHAPLEQVRMRRLDRRHDLTTGILHQHERRNTDVFDGPSIGLAHLARVKNAHVARRIAQAVRSSSWLRP